MSRIPKQAGFHTLPLNAVLRSEVEVYNGAVVNEHLHMVLERLTDGHFELDDESRFVDVNDGAVECLGIPRERLVGSTIWEIFPIAVGTPFEVACREAMRNSEPAWFEGGSMHHLGLRTHTYFYPESGHLHVYLRTISNSAETWEALRRSEATYRKLVAMMPAAIYTCDASGHIISYNATAAELWGRSPSLFDDDDKYCGSFRLFSADYRPISHRECWMAQSLMTGKAFRGEKIVIERPDGSRIMATANVEPLFDDEGTLIGAINVLIDVTERDRAEELLRESEDRFRTLADNIAQLVWMADAEGNPCWFNQRWFEYTGLDPDDVDFQHWQQTIHPGHWARITDSLARCFASGTEWEDTCPLRDKAGQYRWFLSRAIPIRNESGEVELWFGTSTDVTERLEAERQLTELNQTLEQRVVSRTAEVQRLADQLRALTVEVTRVEQRERRRLATILHDHIQQLLVAAQMQLGCAMRNDESLMKAPAAERVLEILKDAIAASRTLTVELSPPILHESGLNAGLMWLANHMSAKHGLTVHVREDTPLEPASDEVRTLLFDSVRELLFNILKHAGVTEACVTLTSTEDGRAVVVVEDHGCGVEPECARHGGSFGLFSIQQRLTHLGGRMEFESAPGRGTRVVLIAPLETPEPKASVAAEQSSSSRLRKKVARKATGCIRVVLADDHEIMREGLAGLLLDESDILLVGEAEDGVQVLELARALAPDVVIMDVNMPHLNGIEATRILSKEHPEIRIVGLSMYAEDDVAAAILDAGASAYLTKGGPAADLISAIRASCPAKQRQYA